MFISIQKIIFVVLLIYFTDAIGLTETNLSSYQSGLSIYQPAA